MIVLLHYYGFFARKERARDILREWILKNVEKKVCSILLYMSCTKHRGVKTNF